MAGESKDAFTKMLRFAVDAITSFSIVPLKVSVILGWVMAAIGFAAAIDLAVSALVGHTVPAWASLMALVGLLAGRQFLMLGIIAAYLGRPYDQSEGRPLFMIRRRRHRDGRSREDRCCDTRPDTPPAGLP